MWWLQAASERITRVAGVSGVARGVGLNDPAAVGEHGSCRPGWGGFAEFVGCVCYPGAAWLEAHTRAALTFHQAPGRVENVPDMIPFSVSVEGVLRALRGPDRRQVGGLFGRWEEIVGDLVARHVRPVRLEDGLLTVEVDEPAWATQFEFLSGQVVDRLRSEVGVDVDRLETRVARRRRQPSSGDRE